MSESNRNMDRVLSADIVVIGGGHAGVQCALAAAENGASVIVCESQTESHMNWIGEQIAAYNSCFLIDHGFGPYDLDEVIYEYRRCASDRVSIPLLRDYVRNSGEMLDHALSLLPPDSTLLDEGQWNVHEAFGKPQYPVVFGGNRTWASTIQFRGTIQDGSEEVPVNGRSRLPELERACMEHAKQIGAKWLFETTANRLEQDDTGRVTAVLAKGPEGTKVRLGAAHAVVLATGNTTEQGHALGKSVGGYLDDLPRDVFVPSSCLMSFGSPPFLALNRFGRRFTDESNFYALGAAFARQPLGIISQVCDANWLESLKPAGIQHGNPDFGVPAFLEQAQEDMSHVVAAGAAGYPVRNLATSERQPSLVWGAESLPALGGYLGYTEKALETWLDSIERYNELCRRGRDEDFGKDPKALFPIQQPPFYGGMIENRRSRPPNDRMCPRGLVSDETMQVLRPAGDPIPGLYAVGNCLGNRYSLFYPTPSGGNMIGQAMTHGRILGKYLAGFAGRI